MAEPVNESACYTIAFAHAVKFNLHASVYQAEIAGVGVQRNASEPPKHAIKKLGIETLEQGGLAAGTHANNHLRPLLPFSYKPRNSIDRMLTVGVYHHNSVTLGCMQPRCCRNFFT